jgi:hypothetical protein
MKLDKTNLGESGYAGEELLQGTSELKRKCYCVKKTVDEDIFTLEQALEAYQVSKEDYLKYLINDSF